ncbi:PHP domain-containing protein [archaeon]|nr:PHP domain-containing protein [archaeon]
MLKADMHLHCSADPEDFVEYSGKELINHAFNLGYSVLSITCHNLQHYNQELSNYAKKKGILLIPGMEKTLQGKHILLYNFEKKELDKIKNLRDINKFKNADNLVVCPHPFLPLPSSFLLNFKKYHYLFDAVEYCHFYTRTTNHNLITKKLSNLPFVGNSDAHFLWQMGSTYSFITSKPKITDVINAIKEKKIDVFSRPLGHFEITKATLRILKKSFLNKKTKYKFNEENKAQV